MSINVTVHGNPVSVSRGKMILLDPDKEFAMRRKIRLQQVRQQSKEIAEDVRNKVKNERQKQMTRNTKNAEKCLSKKKDEMLKTLNEQYQNNLERFGEAYRNAENEVDPEVIMDQIKQYNRNKAKCLGKAANKTLQEMKEQRDLEAKRIKERKQKARYIEDIRSKFVSSLAKNKSPIKKKKKRKVANTSIVINGTSEILSDESVESDFKYDDLSVIDEKSVESDISTVIEQFPSKKHENEKNSNIVNLFTSHTYGSSSDEDKLDLEDLNFQQNNPECGCSIDEDINIPSVSKKVSAHGKRKKSDKNIPYDQNFNKSHQLCIDKKVSERDLNVQNYSNTDAVSSARDSITYCSSSHDMSMPGTSINDSSACDLNVHYSQDSNCLDLNVGSDSNHPSYTNAFKKPSTSQQSLNDDFIIHKKCKKKPSSHCLHIDESIYESSHKKNKSKKKTEHKSKSKSTVRKSTSKQRWEKSPEKSNLMTKNTIQSSQYKKSSSKFNQSIPTITTELPYVPTITVNPEVSEMQTSSVKMYDHFKHIDGMQTQPVLVQKISKESVEVLPSDNEESLHREKISKQEIQAKVRGQKAIEKNKINHDYQQLMEELPVLKRQEQLSAMFKNRQSLHMSEKRLEDYEREKQNRMENAFEQMISNTNIKTSKTTKNFEQTLSSTNPIITLKPMKKLPPSSDVKVPYKTLDITESSSHALNVGQWESVTETQKCVEYEESNIPESTLCSNGVESLTSQTQSNDEKVITDLLQRINKQRDLLIQEAANLPSLVNLKKVLSEQELLKLICKCPPYVQVPHFQPQASNIQSQPQAPPPKILKEMGTSPLSVIPTSQKPSTSESASKSSFKRMAATSSSSDNSMEQKATKTRSKKLVKRSKILIKEEATQTSPALKGASPKKLKIKKEEATQTSLKEFKYLPQSTLKNSVSENSSNSDKLCEIIIRATDNKKVEITHRSTNTEDKKSSRSDKGSNPKSDSVSNYVIKVKENEPKNKSKLMEVSTETSYLSLPPKPNQFKNKLEPTISNKELFNVQKKQSNIDQLIHVEPDGTKEINPRLVKYIKKLLGMSRQSIDELTISTVSDVSTPHESVVQVESNLAKEKLQTVMQHFNLSLEDVQKYISSSTLSSSDLSLENEIKEIMKPTMLISTENTSNSLMDPSIININKCPSDTVTDNELYTKSTTYPSKPQSPDKYQSISQNRPKSPAQHATRPRSPAQHATRPRSPAQHATRPRSPAQHATRPNNQSLKNSPTKHKIQSVLSPEPQARFIHQQTKQSTLVHRPASPKSKSPVTQVTRSILTKLEFTQPSASKSETILPSHPQQSEKLEISARYLSGYIDDVDRSRPESRKQFSRARGIEKFTTENESIKVLEKENSISPQRYNTKYTKETRSFSLEEDPKLTPQLYGNEKVVERSLKLDDSIPQENIMSTSHGAKSKSSISPRSNKSPNATHQSVDNTEKHSNELLKYLRESLGMTTEEFNELGIQDIFSQHSDVTEYCQQRINKLMVLIEKLRNEKISIRTPTPDDPASITITSYLDLPDKKTEKVSDLHVTKEECSSSSTISQETVDKYLLGIEPNPTPPEKTKKHKEKETDVSDGNKFVSDTTETFVPMLQGIPKYNEEPTTSTFLSQGLQELKSKPPPSLLRANIRGYVDVVPHELSTIIEADTLISSRNTSLQHPKSPTKTPKSTRKPTKEKHTPSSPQQILVDPENNDSKESNYTLLSADYVTITPEKSTLNDTSIHSSGKQSVKNRINKSPRTQKASKNKPNSTSTSNQDPSKNICVKSSISGVLPLSDSTNTSSPDELESLLRKFKLEWAISLVKKTEQALALSSSSSTSDIDSKLKSADISATDLYKQLYKKLLSSNASETEKSLLLSDLSSIHDFNELSRIHNFKQDNKSDSRNKSQQQRTSTPVQISNTSESYSKENLFKGDSEISSVRNSSDDNLFLTIPNISLNTTNCSLNKSKK